MPLDVISYALAKRALRRARVAKSTPQAIKDLDVNWVGDLAILEELYNLNELTIDDIAKFVSERLSADAWAGAFDKFYSTDFSALILDNANLSISKAASILNSDKLPVDRAASILDNANLTSDRAASILNSENIAVDRVYSILSNANLSADKTQSILYAMVEKGYLARLIDIMTHNVSNTTLSADTTYSGVNRFRTLDIAGYKYIADGQPHVIIAYEVKDSVGGGVISKTATGGAGGAGASSGSNHYCSGGGGGHPPGSGGPNYGKSGGDISLTTYDSYNALAIEVLKSIVDWFIVNVLNKSPTTTKSIPSFYGAGGGGGGELNNTAGEAGVMGIVEPDSPGSGGDGEGTTSYSTDAGGDGGDGGGGLIVIATTIGDCIIEANGVDGKLSDGENYGGGGGSGGQIIIIVINISNTTVRANGGNGPSGSWTSAGGGGGGVVYVLYKSSATGLTLEANGGSGYVAGGAGTAKAVAI